MSNAIVRDGLKESNVVTKTFTVEDSGFPLDDDNGLLSDFGDASRLENDYRPSRSKFGPQPSLGSARSKVFIMVILITCLNYLCVITIIMFICS